MVAGVVVLAALILVLIFYRRRSKFHKHQKEGPVDLLRQEDDDEDANHPNTAQLPRYYEPEPFIVPDPTVTSASGDPTMRNAATASLRPSNERRLSHYSGTEAGRSSTPDGQSASGSTYMRKSPLPPVFRPVNIVQHEDAGPGDDEEGPAETIELPPAYTNIRSKAVRKDLDASETASDAGLGSSAVGGSETAVSEPTTTAPTSGTGAPTEAEQGATERS